MTLITNLQGLQALIEATPKTAGYYDPSENKPGSPLSDDPHYKGQYGYIYRAVPKGVTTINPKDYVCLGRKFAEEHADTCGVYEEEPFWVLRAWVDAKQVASAYNPGEFFYTGTESKKGRPVYEFDLTEEVGKRLAGWVGPKGIIVGRESHDGSGEEGNPQNCSTGTSTRTGSHLQGQRGSFRQDDAGCNPAPSNFMGRSPGRRIQADTSGPLTVEQLNTLFRDKWGYRFVLEFPSGKRIYRNVAGGLTDIVAEVDSYNPDGWKLTRLHSLTGKIGWEAGIKLVKLASVPDDPGSGKHAITTDESGKFWGDAGAGCVFYAHDTGRVLLSYRSEFVNEPHQWGVWGGAIDDGEDPRNAALREVREETGHSGDVQLRQAFVYTNGNFKYTTYVAIIPKEFVPRLDWETEDFKWCDPGEWPTPTHFGLKAAMPAIESIVEGIQGSEGIIKEEVDHGKTREKTTAEGSRAGGAAGLGISSSDHPRAGISQSKTSAQNNQEWTSTGKEGAALKLIAKVPVPGGPTLVSDNGIPGFGAIPTPRNEANTGRTASSPQGSGNHAYIGKLFTKASVTRIDRYQAAKSASVWRKAVEDLSVPVIEDFYEIATKAMQDDVKTFDAFITKLQTGLGPKWPSFLHAAGGYTGLRPIWDAVTEHDLDDLAQSMEDMRVSPRIPSALETFKGKPREVPLEDPHGPVKLQPDLATMSADRKALDFNVKLMLQYPEFKNIKGKTSQEKAEKIIEHMTDNLVWLYNNWHEEHRERSKSWYVGGNRITHRWAKRFNCAPQAVAGVLASLSPQQHWFQNVTLAERVLSALTEHADEPWDDAMTNVILTRPFGKGDSEDPEEESEEVDPESKVKASPVSLLPKLKGKTLQDLEGSGPMNTYLQALWVRAYDEAHNPNGCRNVSPEGEFGDWYRAGDGSPVKNRWNSFNEVMKAIDIYKDPSVRNISDTVGANHKVRSFYNNLIAPLSTGGDVTIDTHAVAAVLVRPLSGASIPVSHNFGSGKAAKKAVRARAAYVDKKGKKHKAVQAQPAQKAVQGPTSSNVTGITGLYGFYAEAYRRAARQVGIQPREMQSITWEAVRGLFKPQQKRDKDFVAQADANWKDYSDGKSDKQTTRDRLLELAGGIETPSWAVPNPENSAGERHSSYSGQLPSPVEPGSKSKKPARPRGGTGAAPRAASWVGTSGRRVKSALFQRSGSIIVEKVSHDRRKEGSQDTAQGIPDSYVQIHGGVPQYLRTRDDRGRVGSSQTPNSFPAFPSSWGKQQVIQTLSSLGYTHLHTNETNGDIYGEHPSGTRHVFSKQGDYWLRSITRVSPGLGPKKAKLFQRQAGAVDSKEFKAWFGASKLVDNQGQPIPLYHGTADTLDEFDLDHPNRKDTGWLGTGVYLTTDPGLASSYSSLKPGDSPNVMKLYARLVNPYYATLKEKQRIQLISHNQGKAAGRDASDMWTKELQAKGHDGVILNYRAEDVGTPSSEVVVFDPAAVKSATGNSGTYDPQSRKINAKLFQRSEGIIVEKVSYDRREEGSQNSTQGTPRMQIHGGVYQYPGAGDDRRRVGGIPGFPSIPFLSESSTPQEIAEALKANDYTDVHVTSNGRVFGDHPEGYRHEFAMGPDKVWYRRLVRVSPGLGPKKAKLFQRRAMSPLPTA